MGMSEAPSLEELLSGAPKKKPEGATASGEKGSERKETTAKEEEENVCACVTVMYPAFSFALPIFKRLSANCLLHYTTRTR